MNKAQMNHRVRLLSQQTGLSIQAVQTYYFLEVVLRKLVHTPYGGYLVFKGGFVLSNQLGIASRTTIDIDLLVSDRPLTQESVTDIARAICGSAMEPEVRCTLQSVEPIRAQDEYGGFRARLRCQLENIRQVIPLDFATGDPITPAPQPYAYQSLFGAQAIPISAYNAETMLAEKLETVARLGLLNSRSKDFYDIHALWHLRRPMISKATLSEAVTRTFGYRGTELSSGGLLALLDEMRTDAAMQARWAAWTARNVYAAGLPFEEVVQSIRDMVGDVL